MFQRLLLLNLALAAVLIAGVVKLRRDVIAFKATHRVDGIQPEQGRPLPKPASGIAAKGPQDWPDIAARNPFSFDRNDVAVVATPPAEQKPVRPKPVLFGTMMLGPDRLAMLGPGDATTRSSRPVKAGEIFDGWKVLEIQDKSVIVQYNDVKESIIMNDPTAQIQRDYSKTGSSNPSTPAAVAVAAPSAPPRAAAAPAAPAAPPPPAASAGRKQVVVQTPFGPKIMDDPSQ